MLIFSVGYFACAQYDVLFYTSFCQCQVSKLVCKGLRTKIFIRRRHFAKMQNDSFKMRQHYAPYNRSEESHRRTDGYMYFFILVVGYFAIAQYDVKEKIRHSERSEESHRRTDGHILFHLGRGIFR